jgi:hypothetical protein
MPIKKKTKPTPQEIVDLKNLLPLLARLVENGKISIRLGPVRDVKDWLNNYEAFEKSPVVTIDANSVRLAGTELHVDCGLDNYAAQLKADNAGEKVHRDRKSKVLLQMGDNATTQELVAGLALAPQKYGHEAHTQDVALVT